MSRSRVLGVNEDVARMRRGGVPTRPKIRPGVGLGASMEVEISFTRAFIAVLLSLARAPVLSSFAYPHNRRRCRRARWYVEIID